MSVPNSYNFNATSGLNPNNYNITISPNTSGPWLNPNTFYYGDNNTLNVKGNIKCEGEIFLKDKPLGEILEQIQDRLAILVPDPKKLEKFEALKKAYDNYKMIEALCILDDKS